MRTIPKNRTGNDGFTILELIIVIALISITVSFFIMGMKPIFTQPSRQCAREIKAALEKTRIDTMGRNAAGLRIYRDEKGIYLSQLETEVSSNSLKPELPEKAGTALVKLYTEPSTELTKGNNLVLAFKRDTGGFVTESAPLGSGSYTTEYHRNLWVTSGGKTYSLSLNELTGIIDMQEVEEVGK